MSAAKPYQPSLFDSVTDKKPAVVLNMDRSRILADKGLEMAVETANRKDKDWSKLCWQLFLVWLRRKKRYSEFKIEEFREYLYKYDLLEPPPSERAYGFLSKRGVKSGFIEFSGIGKTDNTKAHGTPVNVWRKK